MAGHALMAKGQFRAVAGEANGALTELRAAGEMARLAAPHLEALQGEFFLRTGQREKGRTMLRDVIRSLRAQSGPDAWSLTLFALEAIARGAREAGDWEFARDAADAMREHDHAYAGTHYALGLAAEHFGQFEVARNEYRLAMDSWKRADPNLQDLVEARSRLSRLSAGRPD